MCALETRLIRGHFGLATLTWVAIGNCRTDLQSVDLNCFVVPISVLYFGQFKSELVERFKALFCYLKIDYLSYKF